MKLRNRKIVVTGGAGFIGSNLVDRLVSLENEVIVVDNLASGRSEFLSKSKESVQFIDLDLTEKDALTSVLDGCDTVYHLAANPVVRITEEQTRLHVDQNIMLTYNVLDSMRKANVSDIAFASTSTVYGEPTQVPTPESYGPLIPLSLYGASKLACEALISAYCHTFDMRAVMYRFANVIGSRSTHGVIFDFIKKLDDNPEIMEILGREPGTHKSYIHITDTIEAMIHAHENSEERVGILNIGTDDTLDVRTLADIVVEEMGLDNVEYRWTGGVDDGRGWKGDVRTMLLAIDKMKALGWTPRHGSEDAVRLTARELVKG